MSALPYMSRAQSMITSSGDNLIPRIPAIVIFIALLTGSLAYIIGVLWSDAIRSTITEIATRYPDVDATTFRYVAAIMTTIVVASISILMQFSLRAAYANGEPAVAKPAS